MRKEEFNFQRDKLLEDYTIRARPAHQRYLRDSRSKKSRVSQRAYEVLQTELKPKLDKMFQEIADLKSQLEEG